MKIEEIRSKTGDELEIELQKLRRELFDAGPEQPRSHSSIASPSGAHGNCAD